MEPLRGSVSVPTKNSHPSTHLPNQHKTEATRSRADAEGTLMTKLDGDETKWLITRGDQGEVSPAKQVRLG